jgi:hypothetical protein
LDRDFSAVREDDLTRDVRAKAEMRLFPLAIRCERIEQSLHPSGFDSRPRVVDFYGDPVRLAGGANLNVTVLRAVLQRVGDEVRQQSRDAFTIHRNR